MLLRNRFRRRLWISWRREMAKAKPATFKEKQSRPTVAVLTGGGAGTSLAAFAQTLSEPYKAWVSIAAPAASAIIAAFLPIYLNWASAQFATAITERTKRRAVKAID